LLSRSQNRTKQQVSDTISQALCKKAGLKKSQANTGTVTLIQRFCGPINLNFKSSFWSKTFLGCFFLGLLIG
jgi:hypothetical protein